MKRFFRNPVKRLEKEAAFTRTSGTTLQERNHDATDNHCRGRVVRLPPGRTLAAGVVLIANSLNVRILVGDCPIAAPKSRFTIRGRTLTNASLHKSIVGYPP